MSENEDFRNYIRSLIERGGVTNDPITIGDKTVPSYLDQLTSKENMRELKIAFTHPSVNSDPNAEPQPDYELYEFEGDTIINAFVTFYIRDRYPKIVSVNWLTKIAHMINSKKFLGRLARQTGIEKYIIYGEDMRKEIARNGKDLNKNIDYLSMLEDVVEAFCGCLINLFKKIGLTRAIGEQVVNNILTTFYNAMDISIRYEDVFDPITRLKELYEAKGRGYKWGPGVKIYQQYVDPETKKVTVKVYGWPLGDRTMKDENKKLLANVTADTVSEAKEQASLKALRVLDEVYKIGEVAPDPYKPSPYKPKKVDA
jgi:dsRNA-specific ribonuclease